MIFLARHGQTEWNRDDIIIGNLDSPLTEQGQQTAVSLGRAMADLDVGLIVCSPLGRAARTASLMADRLPDRPTIMPKSGLSELSAGAWQGLKRIDVLPGGDDLRKTWTDRPPGGESYTDAEARLEPVLDFIRAGEENGPILVVGHAGINRVFLKLWLGLSEDEAMGVRIAHNRILTLSDQSMGRVIQAVS